MSAAFTAVAALPSKRSLALQSIKICGVTSADDASWIVETIQHRVRTQIWIGCVLWRHSRRHVSVEEARDIATAVRDTAKATRAKARTVAVFVDEDLAEIQHVCSAAAIDAAQLHGSLAWQEQLLQTRGPQQWPHWLDYARVLQPNRIQVQPFKRAIATLDGRAPCYTLVDPGRGDGKPFDWQGFASERLLGPAPGLWMIAGGLHAGNVAEAVRYTGAPGIDVASGVEMIASSLRGGPSPADGASVATLSSSTKVARGRPRKDRDRLRALLDAVCSVYETPST